MCCAHVTDLKWRKIYNLLLKELIKNRAVYLHKARLLIYICQKKYFKNIIFDLSRCPKIFFLSDRIGSIFWTKSRHPSWLPEHVSGISPELHFGSQLVEGFGCQIYVNINELWVPKHFVIAGFARGRDLSSQARGNSVSA